MRVVATALQGRTEARIGRKLQHTAMEKVERELSHQLMALLTLVLVAAEMLVQICRPTPVVVVVVVL